MPRSRKRHLDADSLRKLEEIEQRARERRLEVAKLLVKTERIRHNLRLQLHGR